MSFEIKLPLFKGPFDLLLFLIERDELDVYDIPISKITGDFLEYVQHLEKLNVEVASEFILVAASLMRIKAKMLVPRPELDEQGNEIDPREELVQKLLEYKKYKSVIVDLEKMEHEELLKESRGNVEKELKTIINDASGEWEMHDADMFKLLKVFQKVLMRYQSNSEKMVHKVVQFSYTITEQKQLILDKVKEKKRFSFTELIEDNPDKVAVIFNFLAILEMLNQRLIEINIGLGYNNFWITEGEE